MTIDFFILLPPFHQVKSIAGIFLRVIWSIAAQSLVKEYFRITALAGVRAISVVRFTAWFPSRTHLADANEADANLVIVSPLERHYSWDAENAKWNRTLQGYAEAGEAWVEAKIAAGARNVAFIDLNKPFSDWMNAELVRINGINPSISLKNAIDYYFFSAKGGKVDATHPNPAGSDWGAYIVWSNALARAAIAEAKLCGCPWHH